MVNIIKIKIKQSLGVAGLGSPIAEIPWGWYRHTPRPLPGGIYATRGVCHLGVAYGAGPGD